MSSRLKVYTVSPGPGGWTATLNDRVVFASPSKARVVSLICHAAQSNAPSSVVLQREDGDVEHEWSYGYELPVRKLPTVVPTPA